MKKKKSIISTIILVLILIVGLSVMLYPIVSNWWNERVQTKAVAVYDKAVSELSENKYYEILKQAENYNARLAEFNSPLVEYKKLTDYNKILNISDTGVMGYVTIPKINVELPIYHGTSAEVLNVAVGHLEGSSFPVGGKSTHAVISAHRGLPSAKLFSDLNKLDKGDTFTITVLNEILTYEVEDTFIIKPEDTEKLNIVQGKDYVTLMTCTPYGVNSHRLLVRAHRIDTVYPNNIKVSADAVQVDPMQVIPIVMAPLIIGLLVYWIFGGKPGKFPHDNPLSVFENNNKSDDNDKNNENKK